MSYKWRLMLSLYLTRIALWLAKPPKGNRYRWRILPSTPRASRFLLEYINDLDLNGHER